LSQGLFLLALILLPFWTHRWSSGAPGATHRVVVTLLIIVFVVLTLWAVWLPPAPMVIAVCAVAVLFYVLLIRERRTIRRVLYKERPAAREE
jgi:hypothetical protein